MSLAASGKPRGFLRRQVAPFGEGLLARSMEVKRAGPTNAARLQMGRGVAQITQTLKCLFAYFPLLARIRTFREQFLNIFFISSL